MKNKRKTIKELEIDGVFNVDGIPTWELRQSAIEDIRQYTRFFNKSMKADDFHSYPNAGEADCVIEYIQWKFNITNKELEERNILRKCFMKYEK